MHLLILFVPDIMLSSPFAFARQAHAEKNEVRWDTEMDPRPPRTGKQFWNLLEHELDPPKQ